jgi:hypothetical protein
MATSQTCCHLPGKMINSAAECADRAQIQENSSHCLPFAASFEIARKRADQKYLYAVMLPRRQSRQSEVEPVGGPAQLGNKVIEGDKIVQTMPKAAAKTTINSF